MFIAVRAICVFLLHIAIISMAGCSDLCRNDVTKTVLSPDGRHRAVVFTRDCGATTDFSTQVSILPAKPDSPPRGSGNVFVGSAVPVSARWESDTSLVIGYPAQARIYKSQSRAGRVRVTYKINGLD